MLDRVLNTLQLRSNVLTKGKSKDSPKSMKIKWNISAKCADDLLTTTRVVFAVFFSPYFLSHLNARSLFHRITDKITKFQ